MLKGFRTNALAMARFPFAPSRAVSLRTTVMRCQRPECNTSQFNEIVIEELLSLFAVAIRDHKQKRAQGKINNFM